MKSASIFKQQNNRNNAVCVHVRAAFFISLLVGQWDSFIHAIKGLESVTRNIVSAREDKITNLRVGKLLTRRATFEIMSQPRAALTGRPKKKRSTCSQMSYFPLRISEKTPKKVFSLIHGKS